MQHKLTIFLVSALTLVIIGYVFLLWQTDQYVAAIKAEVALLETTLLEAGKTVARGAVTQSEAQAYQGVIYDHLETITTHPPSVHIIGINEQHHPTLQEVIKQLEEFLVTHTDTINTLDTTATPETNETDGQLLAKKKSSGEQLFNGIEHGIKDTIDITTGHIEDV